jgi:flagellin-specific chaperone FliS
MNKKDIDDSIVTREMIDTMREVINQHSRDIKKLVDIIDSLKTKLETHDKQLSKMYDVVTHQNKQKNPFSGLF